MESNIIKSLKDKGCSANLGELMSHLVNLEYDHRGENVKGYIMHIAALLQFGKEANRYGTFDPATFSYLLRLRSETTLEDYLEGWDE